jgi:hypothetical protein
MLRKIRTNMVERLKKWVERRGKNIEHVMQLINKIPAGFRLFGYPVVYFLALII